MAIDRWLAKLVSWFAHFISRGLSSGQARERAETRFPGLSQADLQTGQDLGQQSVENAARANQLEPTGSLAEALGNRPPQQSTVDLRVRIHYRDRAGADQYRTVIHTFSWLDDFSAVADFADEMAEELGGQYGLGAQQGAEYVGWEIMNPMMF